MDRSTERDTYLHRRPNEHCIARAATDRHQVPTQCLLRKIEISVNRPSTAHCHLHDQIQAAHTHLQHQTTPAHPLTAGAAPARTTAAAAHTPTQPLGPPSLPPKHKNKIQDLAVAMRKAKHPGSDGRQSNRACSVAAIRRRGAGGRAALIRLICLGALGDGG